MSSHHVIRDNQEPAVAFLDGNQIDQWLDLLEWSPLVAATSELYVPLRDREIFIDILIGEAGEQFDGIGSRKDRDNFPTAEVLIRALVERGQKNIYLVGELDTPELVSLAKKYVCFLVCVYDQTKTSIIFSKVWKKWLRKGDQVILDFTFSAPVDIGELEGCDLIGPDKYRFIAKHDQLFKVRSDGTLAITQLLG